MGRRLFKEYGIKSDIVISVPDSGVPAAIGYAEASKIPFVQGFYRNSYVGRTFIKPSQDMREVGVNTKLSPIVNNIKGKSIVMVDDSLVRGTTIRKIVEALRRAEAKAMHVMVSSPPVTHSCYYGIDTPKREKLIAANNSIEETRKIIGADSLNYLSEEGLVEVLGQAETGLCTACFNGGYPVRLENGDD
jgi:amidophosphoribosyltransferase